MKLSTLKLFISIAILGFASSAYSAEDKCSLHLKSQAAYVANIQKQVRVIYGSGICNIPSYKRRHCYSYPEPKNTCKISNKKLVKAYIQDLEDNNLIQP